MSDQIMKVVTELRQFIEGKDLSRLDSLDKAKVARMHTVCDDFEAKVNQPLVQAQAKLAQQETKIQELVADIQKKGASADEALNRVKDIESQMSRQVSEQTGRKGLSQSETDQLVEYALNPLAFNQKLFSAPMQTKVAFFEGKTLRTDQNANGGFLTSTEIDPEIAKVVIDVAPVAALMRQRRTDRKTYTINLRNAPLFAAQNVGELEAVTAGNSTFTQWVLTPERIGSGLEISQDALTEGTFDMLRDGQEDAMLEFARKFGYDLTLGNGVKKALGFTVDPDIQANYVESGTSSNFHQDDPINLELKLKAEYRPRGVYVFKTEALAFFRTAKATTNSYLWGPGLNGGAPATLNGRPYVLDEDMPSKAAGTYSMAYGDWQRGYTTVERNGLLFIRDDVTGANKALVKLWWHKWFTGKAHNPEAIALLKIKS